MILTIPDPPTDLSNDASITSSSQIGLTWSPSSDGGTAIIDYSVLQYNADTDLYEVVDGNVLTASTTISGVTAGVIYKFKV